MRFYRYQSKYRNKPTFVDGKRFASRKEARRYQELCLLQKAGIVRGLEGQVTYPLIVNGKLVCKYIADFTYSENGKGVVEDCKGMRTREYLIKKKLMKAVYGIEIRET